MNCKHCGALLAEGTRFCPSCGAEVILEEAPQYEQYDNYAAPTYTQPAAEDTAKPVLVWGILGLAFALSFYLSFLGIIFSAVGLKKAKAFAAANGALFGKAKVGRGLALGGLITGIVLTVLFIFVVVVGVIAISNGYYYY